MLKTGAEIFVDTLRDLSIGDVFCITGAGNLALVDEITRASIPVHYFHNEQAAAMAAIGYWRVTNHVPLVLVTTGGGSSNVATGVLSAYLDSIPLLVVTGNESSYHIDAMTGMRAFGVQGFDSVAFLAPICKHSQRLSSGLAIRAAMAEAWQRATTGRTGPVHIDFPMDIQRRSVDKENLQPVSTLSAEVKPASEVVVADLASLIRASKRPLIYVGQGLKDSAELLRFVRANSIPFAASWSALDQYPDSDPLNIGRVGIYGDRAANQIVQAADFLICLGTRLSIPQVGYDRSDFGRNAVKFVVDIDATELGKFPDGRYVKLHADASEVLLALSKLDCGFSGSEKWQSEISEVKALLPRIEDEARRELQGDYVHSIQFVELLNSVIDQDAVVATDVGAGLLSGHYAIESNGKRTIFTSQGLGEMGFGLPAAIGAAIGAPDRQIVCLNTDGGVMFNLQELQTAKTKGLPLKLVVFNNDGYAMIKISQSNLFEGREFGSASGEDLSFPDFEKLAETFGFSHLRWDQQSNLAALEAALSSNSPVLIEVIMDPNQKYLPRLGTRKNPDGSLFSPGIEDLDPEISSELRVKVSKALGNG
jgi:acetolactate synthase-1/2/3 large subunit